MSSGEQFTPQWVLPDGRVGGRAEDGAVLRLPSGPLPGDSWWVVREKRHGNTWDARPERRLADSPDRVPASCPFHERCGGCDLAELRPAARLAANASWVERALNLPVGRVWDSPLATGHRARIKLGVQGGRLGYRSARSHDHLPITHCPAARPEINQALARLIQRFQEEPSAANGLTEVELRSDGERVVYAFAGQAAGPEARAALSALGDVALNGSTLSGNPRLRLGLGPVWCQASPRSFYQVHLELNRILVQRVVELLADAERPVDLYAGIGNFALSLARGGRKVLAVETEGQATEDLSTAAKAQGLPVEVLRLPVERWDPSRSAFDAVVLDPPRAGAPGVLARLARQRPKRIVYLSCHAPSAARDLAELPGYRRVGLEVFDLFPDTHHAEALIWLDRA